MVSACGTAELGWRLGPNHANRHVHVWLCPYHHVHHNCFGLVTRVTHVEPKEAGRIGNSYFKLQRKNYNRLKRRQRGHALKLWQRAGLVGILTFHAFPGLGGRQEGRENRQQDTEYTLSSMSCCLFFSWFFCFPLGAENSWNGKLWSSVLKAHEWYGCNESTTYHSSCLLLCAHHRCMDLGKEELEQLLLFCSPVWLRQMQQLT